MSLGYLMIAVTVGALAATVSFFFGAGVAGAGLAYVLSGNLAMAAALTRRALRTSR